RITEEEVRAAVAKTKVGKAAGPTGLVSEMLTASDETGISWLTDIFNAIVEEGRIPADWKKSWMISVYKVKRDALECGSYRGIKLLDQVMKVFERVIERKMRNLVSWMTCSLDLGQEEAPQIQEKFLAQKKDLWIAFVDLENGV